MSTLLEDIIALRRQATEDKNSSYAEYEDARDRGAHNHESKMYMSYVCHMSYARKLDDLIKKHSEVKQ